MKRPVRPFAALSTLLTLLIAGPATSETQRFTQRIEVRVLEVETIVQDRDGVRVPGLEADSFRLLVDGREVPIEYFTEVRDGTVEAAAPPPPGISAGAPAKTSFLVFVDEFFPLQRDRNRVLEALAERLPGMRPTDQIAIVAWNGESLDVLTGWTGDSTAAATALRTALDRPAGGLQRRSERNAWNVNLDPSVENFATAHQRDRNPFRLSTQERQFTGLYVDQLQGTVAAVTSSMMGLPAPDGRRVLLLLAGGWPMDVTNSVGRNTTRNINEPNVPSGVELYGPIAQTANLLGYTIYAIDIPGMQQGSEMDASRRASTGAATSSTAMFLENELHRTLDFLAVETGGMALINANRINAMDDAAEDIRSFYRIGFSPEWTGSDQRHDIRVEVADQSLMVRSRTSFIDLAPTTKVGLVLESALLLGLDSESSELGLELGDFEEQRGGTVKANLTVTLPAGKLVAIQTKDGWLMQGALVMVAIDNRGNRSETPEVPIAFLTEAKPPPQALLRYRTAMMLRNKTEKLAVALHDPVGGETFARVLTKKDVK